MVFKQIAGLLARRIVFYPKVGDRLERGQRVGLIKFGSRVDVMVDASGPRQRESRRPRERRRQRAGIPSPQRRPSAAAGSARREGALIDGIPSSPDRVRRLSKGMYILPSLFTTANMALGYYAILAGHARHGQRILASRQRRQGNRIRGAV